MPIAGLARRGNSAQCVGLRRRLRLLRFRLPLRKQTIDGGDIPQRRGWRGPMQTVVCDQFGDLDEGYGAKFEAVPAHPGLSALALPWRSQAQHFALMRRARYAAGLIVLTRDRGEGLVRTDGRADIAYRLEPYDARNMLRALAGLAEICFAAGARSIVTLHTH